MINTDIVFLKRRKVQGEAGRIYYDKCDDWYVEEIETLTEVDNIVAILILLHKEIVTENIRSETIRLEGGHYLNFEQKEEIVKEIREWIIGEKMIYR